jgi:ribosomal protein L39E
VIFYENKKNQQIFPHLKACFSQNSNHKKTRISQSVCITSSRPLFITMQTTQSGHFKQKMNHFWRSRALLLYLQMIHRFFSRRNPLLNVEFFERKVAAQTSRNGPLKLLNKAKAVKVVLMASACCPEFNYTKSQQRGDLGVSWLSFF